VRRTHIYIMGIWAYEKTIFRVQVLQVHLELRAAPFWGSIELPSRPTLSIVGLRKLRLLWTKYSIIVLQLLGAYKITYPSVYIVDISQSGQPRRLSTVERKTHVVIIIFFDFNCFFLLSNNNILFFTFII